MSDRRATISYHPWVRMRTVGGNPPVRGAMAVVGFPGAGLSGCVASQFLINSLGMKELGHLDGPFLGPVVEMVDGEVLPCFRAFYSQVACGPLRRCDQLVVVTSRMSPSREIVQDLADGLLGWMVSVGIHAVIVLETIARDKEAAGSELFGATNRPGKGLLSDLGVRPASGFADGFTGALLHASLSSDIPMGVLVAEASPDQPDAIAASLLVEGLSALIPSLTVDPGPLRAMAAVMEESVRRARSRQARARETDGNPSGMFR